MKKSKGTTAVQVEEVKGFNFTEKEIIFLKTMSQSDFWENDIDSVVWDYSVNDFLPFAGKVRSGVISSLEQKGVVAVYKKSKGDIAGTYHLTDEAKLDAEVISIVTRVYNDLPVEETNEVVGEVVEGNEVTTILNGTWKDGMEAKSFEGSVLDILKEKFNCRIIKVKNPTANIFDVTGTPEDIELLTITFTELVSKIRVATKAAYKESDKSLSQFKFTTNYHKVLLETLDIEGEE